MYYQIRVHVFNVYLTTCRVYLCHALFGIAIKKRRLDCRHTYMYFGKIASWIAKIIRHAERTCTLLTIIQSCTLTMHFCLWEIPCNYFPLYFSKERVYTSEGYPMFIFNKRVPKFTFVLVFTYHVNHSLKGAPHLFVILTAIGSFDIDA
jgi:hypothetical protein